MKAIEIINETANFYKKDPLNRRSFASDNDICAYNSSDGNHCAVGRCLQKKYRDLGEDLEFNSESICELTDFYCKNSLDEMLMPRYRGQDLELWQDLQALHDYENFWDEKGLTENGQRKLSKLRIKWTGGRSSLKT